MQVGWYDRKICRVRDLSCGDTRIFLELEVRRLDCRNCGKVKRERLDFLADNPHYTSALPITSAGAVALRRSRTLRRICGWTGIRSRPSTSSTCKPSLRERAGLVRR